MFYSAFLWIIHILALCAPSITSLMMVKTHAKIRSRPNAIFVDATLWKSRAYGAITTISHSVQPLQKYDEVAHPDILFNGGVDIQQKRLQPMASAPGFFRRKFPSFPWHRLPNWLTYCRCVAIPMLIAFFYMSSNKLIPSIIFSIASATDYLDGYLARKWDVTSDFGAFLDPVADKLMVSTALILLAGRYGARVAIPACIILAREIAVSALREWMAGKGLRDLVQVGYSGKVKTATTMLSLTLLLLVPTAGSGPWLKLEGFSFFLLYLSSFITITSGSSYFVAAVPFLVSEDKH